LQRLDLQFYAFFMVILCGAVLGLLFDLFRVARRHYSLNWFLGALSDLLYWGVATVALAGALFYGNWGELRLYVVIGLLLGVGLYYWLASSLVAGLADLVLSTLDWLANLLVQLVLRLVWAPLVAVAGFIWATLRWVASWLLRVLDGLWRLLVVVAGWLLEPLVGPYRFMKLHYLLTKRRLKRRLRHWLLGPPRPRRK